MDADQLAQRRRQAYWRRRRAFDAQVNRGSLLAADRMDRPSLAMTILESLIDLERSARDRSNQDDWAAAQRALEAYHELVKRGDQLELPVV